MGAFLLLSSGVASSLVAAVNMSLASRNVAWDAMRNSSSFRVKSLSGTRAVLSREAGSLSNTHSMSSSGLVNDKAISIQPAAAKEGAFFPVSMRVKTAKNAQKPKSGAATISLSRGGFNRALVNIKRASGDRFYRKDLERAALARYSAIVRSQTPARNDKVAGKGRGRRNRNRA